MASHHPEFTEEDFKTAPWLRFATGELGKGIHEVKGSQLFESDFYQALSANSPRYSLFTKAEWEKVNHRFARKMGQLESMKMDMANPNISKYLRSTGLSDTTKVGKDGYGLEEWRMQAWCAAFVNWCLTQANIKNDIRSARAADWLNFGNGTRDPLPGAVAVLKPSAQWEVQGGSGHAAFFGGFEGKNVWILGGNQGRKVSWLRQKQERVVDYRWPGDKIGNFDSKAAIGRA